MKDFDELRHRLDHHMAIAETLARTGDVEAAEAEMQTALTLLNSTQS